MKAQQILDSEDFKKCIEFHGHLCPGLSIGYKAAKAGMERLREQRAEDEEIVAIVETDACCADAIQVMTGCTFGKGNFIYKDHGKNVFTFLSRKSGNGIRVALKPDAFKPSEEHFQLIQKRIANIATPEENERFHKLHFERSCAVLEKPAEEIFNITSVNVSLPQKARIEPSQPCSACGEPTMASKLKKIGARSLCGECIKQ